MKVYTYDEIFLMIEQANTKADYQRLQWYLQKHPIEENLDEADVDLIKSILETKF